MKEANRAGRLSVLLSSFLLETGRLHPRISAFQGRVIVHRRRAFHDQHPQAMASLGPGRAADRSRAGLCGLRHDLALGARLVVVCGSRLDRSPGRRSRSWPRGGRRMSMRSCLLWTGIRPPRSPRATARHGRSSSKLPTAGETLAMEALIGPETLHRDRPQAAAAAGRVLPSRTRRTRSTKFP